MQRTEPNYSVRDLAEVHVPIAIVQGEHDEFIKLEHDLDRILSHRPRWRTTEHPAQVHVVGKRIRDEGRVTRV